jgi:hypothetical protein
VAVSNASGVLTAFCGLILRIGSIFGRLCRLTPRQFSLDFGQFFISLTALIKRDINAARDHETSEK